MNDAKILEVINIYRKHFIEKGVKALEFTHGGMPKSKEEMLAHCHGMLDKIENFIKEGRREKAFRWLGFIQGCLWSTDQFSLDDLKNHNRPYAGG